MAVQPSYVIIHTMVGTVASANGRFQQANQQASAHYGVALDGHLVQWVDERDAAWHAGNYGINLDSIGIEHEDNGDYNGARTDALYGASAALVRSICQRYNIPIDRAHIRPHKEVSDAPTACPDALDINRIIREAVTPGTVPTPPPAPPVVGPTTDSVHPTSPVAGTVWRPARYLDWTTLAPQDAVPAGTAVQWSEAKLVNGKWYARISFPPGPVDWALDDADVDTGGFTPDHFRPAPPVVVPPVVVPPVVTPPVVTPPVTPPVEPPEPVEPAEGLSDADRLLLGQVRDAVNGLLAHLK